MTPPPTPASELRSLLQQMILVLDLYDVAGQGAVPLPILQAWVARLRRILATLE